MSRPFCLSPSVSYPTVKLIKCSAIKRPENWHSSTRPFAGGAGLREQGRPFTEKNPESLRSSP
jgi:hypothetical protein